MGQQKGCTKRMKGNQPKRIRYVRGGMMVENALKNLRRHFKKYSPNGEDAVAEAAFKRLGGK